MGGVGRNRVTASAGTVMIAGVSIILGLQLLLAFLSFDMNSTPRDAISRTLDLDPHDESMPSLEVDAEMPASLAAGTTTFPERSPPEGVGLSKRPDGV